MECDDCGVVHHGGRWYWGAPPLGEVHGGLCPACERIRDRYPAGTVRVPTTMIRDRDELLSLIRGVAEAERLEHPLERILEIGEDSDGLVVTTTGIHVARRIAGRLKLRFHQHPKVHYDDEGLVQITWKDDRQREGSA